MNGGDEAAADYPKEIELKVFGRNETDFVGHVLELLDAAGASAGESSVAIRESAAARYVSVTVRVTIESEAHFEAVSAALRGSERVLGGL